MHAARPRFRPLRGVLAVFALALLFAGCRVPTALGEVQPIAFDELVRQLPPGGESVELLVDGNTVLRGAYVPPAAGGPLVLHLLESGGSVAYAEGGRGAILCQLADLGIGSLMMDWTGVGVSSGERANENLRRDASAMWREALRLVDGDSSRLIVRAASLGTLAAADLLSEGHTLRRSSSSRRSWPSPCIGTTQSSGWARCSGASRRSGCGTSWRSTCSACSRRRRPRSSCCSRSGATCSSPRPSAIG